MKPRRKRTHIAIEIANLFDCDTVIETCYQLIKFSRTLFNAVDKGTDITDDIKRIFNAEHYDSNQCVLYIYRILNLVNGLTMDNSVFSKRMTSLDLKSLVTYKDTFKNIIPVILKLIKSLSQSKILNDENSGNDGLSACYHILDHLLELLYPDLLLQVVDALLCEKNAMVVREKIIDLLNKKLESPELFTNCKNSILSLLGKMIFFVCSRNILNSLLSCVCYFCIFRAVDQHCQYDYGNASQFETSEICSSCYSIAVKNHSQRSSR